MINTLIGWSSGLLALLGIVIPFPGRFGKLTEERRTSGRPARDDIRPATAPLKRTDHFAKVGRVISDAVATAAQIRDMQEKARTQLEVVEITIDRLLEDVAEVMALPVSLSARPVRATVSAPMVRRAA